MTEEISLSDEEYAIIRAHRAKLSKERMLVAIKLLDIATEWAKFRNSNGAGSSLSTFANDFGYAAEDGEDRPDTLEKVDKIIEFANMLLD